MNINYPNITDLSDKGKNEIKNYLFSLVNQLNYSFTETEKNTKNGEKKIEMVEKKYDDIDNSLKTIISLIKSLKSNGGETDNGSYEQGVVDGKKAEYDNFWDSFQDFGNRTNFGFAFTGQKHLANWFYPKYDIKPTAANNFMDGVIMYADTTTLLDLAERLKECGVNLDFSESTSNNYAFNHATISRLPELDLRKSKTHNNFFGRYIETVDKLIFNGEVSLANIFIGASNLKNIVFYGILRTTGLNMSYSKSLSKQSIKSLFNALANDTTGLTVTLSKQAVNKAFETSEGANDGSNSTEWKALADTKKNWTITLS